MSVRPRRGRFRLTIATLLSLASSWYVRTWRSTMLFSSCGVQWMHNGNIADFQTMKRRLQNNLPDVAFDMVQGNTGAFLELACSLFELTDPKIRSGRLPCSFQSSRIARPSPLLPMSYRRRWWLRLSNSTTMPKNSISPRYRQLFTFSGRGLTDGQPSLMNFCVTDGETVVATRYVSSSHFQAASLVGFNCNL